MILNMRSIAPIVLAGTILFVTGACRSLRPAELPEPIPVPASFSKNDGSQNAGKKSWREFFTDPLLSKLIDTALLRNPEIHTGLQRLLISRANVLQARGASAPAINATVTAGGDKYGGYTQNGVGNFDTNLSPNIDDKQKIPVTPTTDFFLGLRSSWEIDIWGKWKNRRRAAETRYAAGQAAQKWFVTQVVATVANLYYELLSLDNQLDILKANEKLQQRAVEIVEAQMEGGRATLLAVQQFKAQLLNTRSAAFTIRQSLDATENEINFLLGRFPQPIERDTSIIALPLPALLETGVPAEALRQRADITEAELGLAATKADLRAARQAFFPSLTLTAYGGYNAFRTAQWFAPESLVYGFLGGLTAPLLNQRTLRTGLAIANATQTAAFYTYQKQVLQAYKEVLTDVQQMGNYTEAYRLKAAEVDTLNTAVGSANDLYFGGYANYLEVITAQRSVLEAELQRASLKKDIFQSSVRLYRSLGGG